MILLKTLLNKLTVGEGICLCVEEGGGDMAEHSKKIPQNKKIHICFCQINLYIFTVNEKLKFMLCYFWLNLNFFALNFKVETTFKQ
jgi:hypothetical protein